MDVPLVVRSEVEGSLLLPTVDVDTGVQECEAWKMKEAAAGRERVLCKLQSAKGTEETAATGKVMGDAKVRRVRWVTKASSVRRTGAGWVSGSSSWSQKYQQRGEERS